MKAFFDSNILVYLFDRDSSSKQLAAQGLLERCSRAGEILLSTQVLQEFYVSVTRKLAKPLDKVHALQALRDFAAMPIVQIDALMVLGSAARSISSRMAFWDALIVEAAISGGASILYSEDLQHGQRFDKLEVRNPFK